MLSFGADSSGLEPGAIASRSSIAGARALSRPSTRRGRDERASGESAAHLLGRVGVRVGADSLSDGASRAVAILTCTPGPACAQPRCSAMRGARRSSGSSEHATTCATRRAQIGGCLRSCLTFRIPSLRLPGRLCLGGRAASACHVAKPGSMFALPDATSQSYADRGVRPTHDERHRPRCRQNGFAERLAHYSTEINAVHPSRGATGGQSERLAPARSVDAVTRYAARPQCRSTLCRQLRALRQATTWSRECSDLTGRGSDRRRWHTP